MLKPEQYGLEVAGQPRQLQPKVFELLTFLVANRDRVVSKEELLGNIWDGAYVTEAAISRAVSEARKVLAGGGGSAEWITTVYGRGFRFTGPVIEDLAAPEDSPSVAVPPPPEEERGLSIAVLPFADRSPQRDQAHLCEGMAEEILHRLAHVVGLRVTARGVSFQYDALADPRVVGRQIGADLVLAGTVRKEGRRTPHRRRGHRRAHRNPGLVGTVAAALAGDLRAAGPDGDSDRRDAGAASGAGRASARGPAHRVQQGLRPLPARPESLPPGAQEDLLRGPAAVRGRD